MSFLKLRLLGSGFGAAWSSPRWVGVPGGEAGRECARVRARLTDSLRESSSRVTMRNTTAAAASPSSAVCHGCWDAASIG